MPHRLIKAIALVKVQRAVGNRKRRRFRGTLPKQTPPTGLEREYASWIRDVVIPRVRRAFAPLIQELPGLLFTRGDSERFDSPTRARGLIDRAREQLRAGLGGPELDNIAARFADRTQKHNAEQINKQTRAAFGVELIDGNVIDASMRAALDSFVVTNAELIKDLGEGVASRIGKDVLGAIQKGQRWEDLAKQLEADFGFGTSRAKLIARDQVGTLYGQVNATRQKALGITRFRWRTVKDDRVRSEHEDREGEIYEYSDPPDGELPGEPINCRCHAEPVLDDLLAGLD